MQLRSHFPTRRVSRTVTTFFRVMAPTLIALSFATMAHAQGTMDFSGAQTLMGTFKTFAMYAGAVICLGGLIFAGIRMMSGRFQDAIPGLFGPLFGAGVLGWGAGWIGSLSAKARSRAAIWSRASPRPAAPPASSATRALPPTPCRDFLLAAGVPTRL